LAADYGGLADTLSRFYDFTGKVVLYVGAGGRQLLDPSIKTKSLIVIDRNTQALEQLKKKVTMKGRGASAKIVGADFADVKLSGEVVYFEFCLHEMSDPQKSLEHARALAPDIVVYDHSPGSEWTFYTAEEDKVRASSEAMKRFGIRRRQVFRTEQRFADYPELRAKIVVQGPVAIKRARRFAGTKNIVIPMNFELALL
jgi:hypothetical protein